MVLTWPLQEFSRFGLFRRLTFKSSVFNDAIKMGQTYTANLSLALELKREKKKKTNQTPAAISSRRRSELRKR